MHARESSDGLSGNKLFIYGIATVLLFLIPLYLTRLLPAELFGVLDLWFGADLPRVVENMTLPNSDHYRTSVHPIFSLIALPLARPLVMLGAGRDVAARLVVLASAPVTGLIILNILRRSTVRLLDALLMVGLFASTAAFLFWWTVPETFALGAVSILMPFWLLSLRATAPRDWLVVSAASLSITTTNFLAGLASSWFALKKKIWARTAILAVVTVIILSIVQKSYIPTSRFFWIPANAKGESTWLSLRPDIISRTMHFVVSPAIITTNPVIKNRIILLPEAGIKPKTALWWLRSLAAALWLLLLAGGILSMIQTDSNADLTRALSVFIGSEYILHLVYGDSPFLYSAHYLPAMVVLVGLSLANSAKTSAAMRRWIRSAAVVFIALSLPLNIQAFLRAVHLAESFLKVL